MAQKTDVEKSSCLPTRLGIGLMVFITTFVGYILRVNLSVSILGMVRTQQAENQTIKFDLPNYGPRYNWSNSQQNLVLSAFFYGNIATQMLGGIMNQMLGPRLIVGACLGLSAIATAFVPLAAESSTFWAVFFVRVYLGAAGGIITTGIMQSIAKWAPPQEKGKFVLASIGGTLGTVFTWPFVAYLMTHFGWVYTFYIPAMIVLVVAVLWFYTVYDTPAEHPRITENELKFIRNSQGDTISNSPKGMPPIRCMMTSIPFWALIFLHFGHLWSFFFFLVATPKYLNEVLKFDITQSGFLSSAPYLSRFICGFIFGMISDYLIKYRILSTTAIRKFFSIFSHIVPGILLFSLRYVGDNPMHCVVLITIALAFNGASTVVSLTNTFDLAPNYAGTLSAIINTFGTSAGIIAPFVVSYFTREQNTVNEWNHVFLISSALYISSAILFMFFGSGEVQDWNDDTYKIKRDVRRKLRQSDESHF